MRRLPLLLAVLAATLPAADDTPANRQRLRELDHASLLDRMLIAAERLEIPVGPRAVKLRRSGVERMHESGELAAIAAACDRVALGELTNEELATWHLRQTQPEALAVRQMSLLVTDDIRPVIQAEAQACLRGSQREGLLEIEERWQVVPARRRDLLGEILPLLDGSASEQTPAKLLAAVARQAEAEARTRGTAKSAVDEIPASIARRGPGRLLNACAESYTRRLTTAEARWLLESLRDPAYRSASLKMEPVIARAIEEATR